MAESTVTADSKLTSSDTRRRIWAIVGASSGNLVEWFDFYVYSFCSLYFAHIFFPSGNTTTQLLQTAGVFAAGFLMRPIGGWLFGRIADKHGRKKSMLLSVCMMCFGSLVIACLPGYETIGTWAPALLLLARLFQGLSVGGEYGTSATYMSEVAVEGRKGFYASFQYVTLIGGQLLALLVVVVLQHTMEDAALREWGWRIPFALGAVLAVVALWLRRQLDETSQTRNTRFKRSWISERIMAQSPCIHHGSRFYRCGLPLFLYLHHLYAEVSGKYCGNACQRGEWHYDCRIVCIHAYSTTYWRAVG